MSSIGTTCVSPPPAAPPLIPNTGPSDGSRRHSTGRLPMWPSPWVRDTDVVVLPSPALVGVMAETQTTLALGASFSRSITPRSILALYLPYRSTSSSSSPASRAMSMIGRRTLLCDLEAALHEFSLRMGCIGQWETAAAPRSEISLSS